MANTSPLIIISVQKPEALAAAGIPNDGDLFAQMMGIPSHIPVKIIRLPEQEIPPTITEASGIIIGGSAHSVNENLSWMKLLEEVVLRVMNKSIPLLGVCFGLQIVIKALGGHIARGQAGREIGPTTITLTEAGKHDPLFEGLPEQFAVNASHEEIIAEFPQDTIVRELAHSERYPCQALAIGDHIRLVQFHPEIDGPTMARIIRSRRAALAKDMHMADDQTFDEYAHSVEQSYDPAYAKKLLINFRRHFLKY